MERVVRIALEIYIRDDGLAGTASTDDGDERPFEGWLSLVATLDSLVTAPEAPARWGPGESAGA